MERLKTKSNTNREDAVLVSLAIRGNSEALEELVRKHQKWIFRLSLYFLGDDQAAEDVSQEILIKMITGLSGFRGDARFTTWLYRICVNTARGFKQKRAKTDCMSFEQFSAMLEDTPDGTLPSQYYSKQEEELIYDEVRSQCLLGMLLCLSMEQRILLVLSDIFLVSQKETGQILNIQPILLRKRLERARVKLYQFMNEECGLIHSENSCKCTLKARALVDQGLISLPKVSMAGKGYASIREQIEDKRIEFTKFYDENCASLLRSYNDKHDIDFIGTLRELVLSEDFRRVLSLPVLKGARV